MDTEDTNILDEIKTKLADDLDSFMDEQRQAQFESPEEYEELTIEDFRRRFAKYLL